jgi:pimeloyl-ACP methyl ester carboxylesterase
MPGFVARDILRISKEHAWVIHRALDSMITGQDATDNMLPQLKMPVLIVWGSLDRIVPLEQGEMMHRWSRNLNWWSLSAAATWLPASAPLRSAPRWWSL